MEGVHIMDKEKNIKEVKHAVKKDVKKDAKHEAGKKESKSHESKHHEVKNEAKKHGSNHEMKKSHESRNSSRNESKNESRAHQHGGRKHDGKKHDFKGKNESKNDAFNKNEGHKSEPAVKREMKHVTVSDGTLKMVALSGAEEIGMNMTLYIYENKHGHKFTILVDCGVSFEAMPGVNVVMPDVGHLAQEGISIDAMVLTHGHEDHIGAIPYLHAQLNLPMYATPFTVGLIKSKMEYNKIKDYMLETVNCGETRQIGPFTIKWIAVTHSIPDSAMLAIEVDGVRVLHTGDWKIDPEPIIGPVVDVDSIQEFASKGIHALISDSTNIHLEETAHSEGEVAISLKDLVRNTKKGRFVLTCFASNIARVQSCLAAAEAAGRKVLILGASLKRSMEVAVDLKYVSDDIVISEEEASDYLPEHLMIVSTGSQGEINSALWKMANKSRTAGAILEKGDTVVFSARVIDGRQHDVRVIINQLVERGIRVLHPWNSQDSCIHASGHPARPDIAKLLEWSKPKYVIPVHCEAEHRISHIAFAQSKGFKTFNLHNGVVIEIAKDDIIKRDTLHHGKLAYDGNRLIAASSDIFKQRKEMNDNGVIIISIAFKNKKPVCVVTSYGVYDKTTDINLKKNISFSKQLKYDIERALSTFAYAEFVQKESSIKGRVFDIARNTIWNQIRKNPVIGCHIIA